MAFGVGGFERVGNLDPEAKHLGERKRSAFEMRGERFAIDQFEDEVLGLVLVAKIEQAADVWVIERGDRLGLTG